MRKATKNTLIVIAVVIGLLIVAPILIKYTVRETLDNYKIKNNNRKILILYTGGTIGMVESKQGYVPKKHFLEKKIKDYLHMYPDIAKKRIAKYDIIESSPLLDSSDMTPNDWNKISSSIEKHYNSYGAFIVIHGTDTLAYTSSALSFAFENLTKPIIVTGSQIPLARMRNDGMNNIITSLILASNYDIPEVMVVFNNQILRGNRSVKISSNKLNAFQAPNFPQLGAFGYDKMPKIDNSLIRKSNFGITRVHKYNTDYKVIVIWLTPGIDFTIFKNLFHSSSNVRGVILATYGIGDGPVSNHEFIGFLNFLKERDIVVINHSQCLEGKIDSTDYKTGSVLKAQGVNSTVDMTIECSYAKLLFLFSIYGNNTGTIREAVSNDLRGELNVKGSEKEFAIFNL